MEFNVTCEKYVDMVSDSTLLLTFKKLLFVELGGNIRKENPLLPEKATKILLYFPSMYLHEAGLFL